MNQASLSQDEATRKRYRDDDETSLSSSVGLPVDWPRLLLSDVPDDNVYQLPFQLTQVARLDLVNRLSLGVVPRDSNVEVMVEDLRFSLKKSALVLAEALQNNVTLISLLLAQNSLSNVTLSPIIEVLPTCHNLMELNLSANRLRDGTELFDALYALRSLKTLHLGFNNFHTLENFRCSPTLEHLDLRSNPFVPEALSILSLQIRTSKLRVLILDDCTFGDGATWHDFCFGVAWSSIESVSLSGCLASDEQIKTLTDALCGSGGTEVKHALAAYLPSVIVNLITEAGGFWMTNTSLKELNLSHNRISPLSFAILADALVLMRVTSLKLAGMTVSDAIALCLQPQGLSNLNFLTLMHAFPMDLSDLRAQLECKTITSDQSDSFRQTFGCKVDLAKKGYGSAEIVVIVALIQNHNVTELNLRENSITETGIYELAAWLLCNKTLRVLDLSHNPIGSLGAQTLAFALEHNSTLSVLKLNKCGVSADILDKIEASLRSNNTQQQDVVISSLFETPPLNSPVHKKALNVVDSQPAASKPALDRHKSTKQDLILLPWVCVPSHKACWLKAWKGTGSSKLAGSFVRDPLLLTSYDLRISAIVSMGREKGCDIQVCHDSLSRRHLAFIHSDNRTVYIVDLGSVHGSFLNSQRLKHFIPVLFVPGAVLSLGGSSRFYTLCTLHSAHAPCTCMPVNSLAAERVLGLSVRRPSRHHHHHFLSAYPSHVYQSQLTAEISFEARGGFSPLFSPFRTATDLVSPLQESMAKELVMIVCACGMEVAHR